MNISIHRAGFVRALIAGVCLLSVAGAASAQVEDIEEVRVTLPNGNVVTGELVSRTDENITINNETFGRLTIPLAEGVSVETISVVSEEEQPPAEEEAALEAVEENPWEIRFELGASGSRGNTDRDNLRTAITLNRDTEEMATLISADYRWAAEDGGTTENRFYARARNEWKVPDSKWSYFVQGDADVDEFKDYDVRVSLFGGAGYLFIDTEEEKFKGRIGLGASRPFGAPQDDEWVPEGLLGIDYFKKLNDSVTFTALAEYYPNLEDLNEFRARGEAALEIALDKDKTWFLRLNVEDRYESQVGPGVDKNDFYYGAAILLVF
ncbi:MAG: YdiY family protein [Phycisphaerales bacterium]